MKNLMKKVFFATTLMALTAGASMAADYKCTVFQNDTKIFSSDYSGASDKASCLKKVKVSIRAMVGEYGGGLYKVTWGAQDGFQPTVKKYRARGPARVPASAEEISPSREPAAVARIKKQLADEHENIGTYKSEIQYHQKNIAKLNQQLQSM